MYKERRIISYTSEVGKQYESVQQRKFNMNKQEYWCM